MFVVFLVTLACNLPTTAQATATLTPTALQNLGVQEDPAPQQPTGQDLAIEQLVVRYDALQTNGTFGALVCNWGQQASSAFSFELRANGVISSWEYAQPIAAGMCAATYAESMDLPAFGITSPQTVQVSAAIAVTDPNDDSGNHTLQSNLNIQVIKTPASIPGNQYPDQYPLRQDPHEILINVNEYWVLVPTGYESLAHWALWDNQNCISAFVDYLAIAPPAWVAQTYLLDDGLGGGYFAYGAGIFVSTDLELLDYYAGELPRLFNEAREGTCSNAHELTHLILGEPPMPGWLNEGLATYMEDPQRVGNPAYESIECREAGWFGTDFNGDIREVPYEDLMTYDLENIPGIHYYRSGSCFWDYIESTYGRAALQQIVQQLVAASDIKYTGCSVAANDLLLIRDIVNPVVGEDVSPVTLERWGFDVSYHGCEDQGF
ncbi:MAG: hypothetical protein DWQ07_21195 [Chloroflexi bacterium]|nr:MAG: hypothetical protein DWQ07_21195 [Chloroflexota bacterium]MBL1194600.1 hypothetical protein [Chloroflexota bacterium]